MELGLYGMTHLESKSHMNALKSHLSRTIMLASYSLSRLHVLCNTIYMSLHHTHLYGSSHKTIWVTQREDSGSTPFILYHMYLCIYVQHCLRVGGKRSRKFNLCRLWTQFTENCQQNEKHCTVSQLWKCRAWRRLLTGWAGSFSQAISGMNICAVNRPQPKVSTSENSCFLFLFHLLSVSSLSLALSTTVVSSLSSLIMYMYIYKRAYNWYLGKGKGWWGKGKPLGE